MLHGPALRSLVGLSRGLSIHGLMPLSAKSIRATPCCALGSLALILDIILLCHHVRPKGDHRAWTDAWGLLHVRQWQMVARAVDLHPQIGPGPLHQCKRAAIALSVWGMLRRGGRSAIWLDLVGLDCRPAENVSISEVLLAVLVDTYVLVCGCVLSRCSACVCVIRVATRRLGACSSRGTTGHLTSSIGAIGGTCTLICVDADELVCPVALVGIHRRRSS